MQRSDDGGRTAIVKSDDLPTFWARDRLPTPQKQADDLVIWIGDNQPTQLERAIALPSVIAAFVGLPLAPGGDGQALGWLFREFEPMGLFSSENQLNKVGLRLTMRGWAKYEELKRARTESRTAFMAMKFGNETLNRVVDECFRPAVARTGFELRVLTDQQPAGLIDDQMRAAILGARFLIADLSHGSHGAYWEAGFAEGLGMPVIYTCEASAWAESKTHFDTNHLVTVQWDASDLEPAGRLLTATIRATLRADAKQSG